MDDESTEIQKQVICALAQLPDGRGIDKLIVVPKTHKNPKVRKTAVQCLGQAVDPRALEALIEIVKK